MQEILTSMAVAQIKKRIPMSENHIRKVRELFDRYDSDKDDSLDLNELALLLQEISSKITPLPAVSIYFLCPIIAFSLVILGRLLKSLRNRVNILVSS